MAAEKGSSQVTVAEVTNHCKTNIWTIEKFLPVKFSIHGNIISCKHT
jgi:RNA 3'-terminal phosphate cyclase